MDGRILATIFWAGLANTMFLLFSLVRIFVAKEVMYGLTDLFRPQFYFANPIFIVLMIIGPVTFISDLMVFSAAGEVSTRTLGLLGLSALNLVGVIFFGSEGYMVMPGYTCYYTFLGKNRTPGPKHETTGDPAANPDHFRNFIRAVRSRKHSDLTADIAEGHLSAALSHLANISWRTGRTLRFDPRAERFPGDDEANRLLTREYRPPFVVPEEV